MNCRHCHTPLTHRFMDLGHAPPSNAYLSAADLGKPETILPLRVLVCDACWLVQTEDYAAPDAFFNASYAYFSSTSRGWLAHAAHYVDAVSTDLKLGTDSFVIEVASNDGYLLKNFVARGVPCLGIEPTASTAAAAEALGIPVLREFFGESLGRTLQDQHRQADLIVGNNVFAHVPDINDFARGLKAALKPNGTVTLEFPHVLQLIRHCQFDTIYHEHFSYLSLFTVQQIFALVGLKVIDVHELPTHGGSLRVFGAHDSDPRPIQPSVSRIAREEQMARLRDLATYADFQTRADMVKDQLLEFLRAQQRAGKTVAAYGAAAKGNTLLNYAGVKPDLLAYVADAAAAKQGQFMPGSHIPIVSPNELLERRPDFVLILPWNIADEVRTQMSAVRRWGGRFVVAVPSLEFS